jgi:hypothetical protein
MVPFLIDTGAQASFIALDAVEGMGINTTRCQYRNFITFNGASIQKGHSVAMSLRLPNGATRTVPMFVVPGFENNLQAEQISEVIHNIKTQGHRLSPNSPSFDSNGHLAVKGLLGVDILPMFPELRAVPCMNGMAFEVGNGIIPFGDAELFIPVNQLLPVKEKETSPSLRYASDPSLPGAAECVSAGVG